MLIGDVVNVQSTTSPMLNNVTDSEQIRFISKDKRSFARRKGDAYGAGGMEEDI